MDTPTPTDPTPVPAAPNGYATVTPWLISPDTKALMGFLATAFGAEEIAVLEEPDGVVTHAESRIGDAVVLLFDTPPGWPEVPSHLRLYATDADATVSAALGAGAELVTPVTELFWGDRVGRIRDPQGNIWWIQQAGPPLEPEEMTRRSTDPGMLGAMGLMATSLIAARS